MEPLIVLLSVVSPRRAFLCICCPCVWAVPHVVGGGGLADPRLTDYDTLLSNIRDLKDGKSTQVSALVCLRLQPFLQSLSQSAWHALVMHQSCVFVSVQLTFVTVYDSLIRNNVFGFV